jgi:probable HAF family extracellular repeat protein
MRNQAFLARATTLLAALALVVSAGTALAAGPTVTDLGTLPTGTLSVSGGINAQGQIAGTGNTSLGFRAFRWDGALLDLGTLPGGNRSFGNGINAAGQVVGQARTGTGQNHAFLWDPATGMQDLGTLPGGTMSQAYAINGAGEVVGESNFLNNPFTFHAFFWSPGGGMVDLGTLPGGSFSIAYTLNESGQAAGESDDASGTVRAFRWDSVGGMVDLGTLPGGTTASARGINALGQVVGWADTAGGATRAFLWDPATGMQDLGSFPGGGDSFALGINDLGQVVGQAVTAGGTMRAFVWDPVGGMQELPPLAGGGYSAALAINNAGQVAGESGTATGDVHAVRWQLNRPPTAQAAALTTPQDTPLAVTLGGSDPDGDPLGFAVATGPSHGSLSGTPPNLTYTPNPGWSGTDSFSYTASDGTLSSAAATVTITVTPAPVPVPEDELAGKMRGQGHVGPKHFVFVVGRRPGGQTWGRLHFWQPREDGGRPRRHDRFVATAIDTATFSDDPALTPGRRPAPAVDTVLFTGTGTWNGAAGYAFEARATDAGEPGRGRDGFAIVITGPDGEVARVEGLLTGGNVQSKKLRPPAAVVAASERRTR